MKAKLKHKRGIPFPTHIVFSAVSLLVQIVFFVVMSYGFFVTSTVTFLHRTFRFPSDYFMYPPFALALTLIINLVLAKPFLMLMERIRTMINADLESRIWKILCSLPAYSDCQHCTVLKHNKSFQ